MATHAAGDLPSDRVTISAAETHGHDLGTAERQHARPGKLCPERALNLASGLLTGLRATVINAVLDPRAGECRVELRSAR